MNRKDFIDNPTFGKLLERATKYSHLIPLNEQEKAQETNNPTPPQTGQPTPPAEKEEVKPTTTEPTKKVDAEGMTYLCTEVAKEMIDLLQSYRGISPDGRKGDFSNLNLDSIASAKTMGVFVDGINKALGVVDGVIASSKNAELYTEATQSKNSAMSEYMNALKGFPGYDPNLDISAGLQKAVKPAIETAKKTMSQMAGELASLGGETQEAPSEATAGFGHFVNFKTFESLILEQEDDLEDDGLSGQSPYPVINKLWSLYNKAVKKASRGNKSGSERIAKKIVKLIATTDEDIKRRILIVRHGIWNAQTDPRYRDFKALDYESKFDSLDGEVTYAENAIIKTELDSEDLQKITDEIKETDEFLKRFDQMKKEYVEMFDQEKKQLNSKRGNTESYDAISKGNSFKDQLKSFSALQKKASTTTASPTSGKSDKTTDKTSGLKITGEIKQGGGFNQEVKDFQAMVINKFKGTEPFKSSSTFNRFMTQGGGQGDGRFGPTTLRVIKAVRGYLKLEIKDTIDQKLVDAVQSAKLNESRMFSFDSFMNEQYDAEAAKKYLEDDKPADKASKTQTAAKGGSDKKIPNKEVKAKIGTYTKEDKDNARKKIMAKFKGLESIDAPERMAIAKGKGIVFYPNNSALRTWDKQMGTINIETGQFNGDDKSTDKIQDLINGAYPSKYKIACDKLEKYNIAVGSREESAPDPDLLNRIIKNWSEEHVRLLSIAYFNLKKRSLYKDLKKSKNSVQEEDKESLDNFMEKFEDVIKGGEEAQRTKDII